MSIAGFIYAKLLNDKESAKFSRRNILRFKFFLHIGGNILPVAAFARPREWGGGGLSVKKNGCAGILKAPFRR